MSTTLPSPVDLARVRAQCRSGDARRIREAADVRVSEVARELGVSVSTLWRWEAGERSPCGEPAVRYGRLLERLRKVAAA